MSVRSTYRTIDQYQRSGLTLVTHNLVSFPDHCKSLGTRLLITQQPGGNWRALLSGGYQYLRIRKGIDRQEFWQRCLWACVAKVITVEDQLEAVRGEHNHAPNLAKCNTEKVVATIRELEKRLRLSHPCTRMLYICYFKIKKLTFWELTFWELTFWEVDILGSWHFGKLIFQELTFWD